MIRTTTAADYEAQGYTPERAAVLAARSAPVAQMRRLKADPAVLVGGEPLGADDLDALEDALFDVTRKASANAERKARAAALQRLIADARTVDVPR